MEPAISPEEYAKAWGQRYAPYDEAGDDVSFYREGLLASDNAKLRELCANLWVVAKSGSCIDRCKLYDTCMPNYDENGCMLKRQLREFGIGVSE